MLLFDKEVPAQPGRRAIPVFEYGLVGCEVEQHVLFGHYLGVNRGEGGKLCELP